MRFGNLAREVGMRYRRLVFVVLLIFQCMFSAGSCLADEHSLITTVSSNKTFEDTLQHLRWQFGTYNLTVTSAMNYGDILSGSSPDIQKAAVIEFMNQQWIEDIIQSNIQMAIWSPMRILVFVSDEGSVMISYVSPLTAAELSGFSDPRALDLMKTVDRKLAALVRNAAR